jgi:hypothetical protein
MAKQGYTPGDKHSTGNAMDLGLTEQSAVDGGTKRKLRGETSLKTQRPTAKTETVSSDRGSFPSKC